LEICENSHKMKILLADDEPDVLEFLSYNLVKAGYNVVLAKNGQEALEVAIKEKPDVFILDVMMPFKDGITVCKELRMMPEFESSLIMFLTAKTEDETQIQAFDIGANDYISKPIKPTVFLSKLKSMIGHSLGKSSLTKLVRGKLEMDIEKYALSLDGNPISLARKEFKLLFLLASKPGKVFNREEILDHVWGNEIIVGDRTVDVHIRKLREKLGNDDYIKTIKGVGYKFEF
jgi:two-component system alkaline phosphatase synthesis response regulator PhoP